MKTAFQLIRYRREHGGYEKEIQGPWIFETIEDAQAKIDELVHFGQVEELTIEHVDVNDDSAFEDMTGVRVWLDSIQYDDDGNALSA